MPQLTAKQRQVLALIRERLRSTGILPTYQEIADHFGFRSLNAVTAHVKLLVKKGYLLKTPGKARSFQLVGEQPSHAVEVPLIGSIPAGHGENLEEYAEGWISA